MNVILRKQELTAIAWFGMLVMLIIFGKLQVGVHSTIPHLQEQMFYMDASRLIGYCDRLRFGKPFVKFRKLLVQ